MKKDYKNKRSRTLNEIAARHAAREIKGFHSWRHFAVHQDRAWLLNAINRIRDQVRKIQKAQGEDQSTLDSELQALMRLFEEETLDHIGDQSE